jgi:hypothetical protein
MTVQCRPSAQPGKRSVDIFTIFIIIITVIFCITIHLDHHYNTVLCVQAVVLQSREALAAALECVRCRLVEASDTVLDSADMQAWCSRVETEAVGIVQVTHIHTHT